MKEGLSDFLKIAYKYGKVKDLEEAFKEFPVEEEWHKGKVDNVLREDRLFKIGKVDNEKIEEYKKSFYDILKDNN